MRKSEILTDSSSWASAPSLSSASNPLVSIVVCAYNYERFVGAMLDSLQAQTYPAIEIIIVHEWGPDKTGDIVRRFMTTTTRPARLIERPNTGIAKALQRGFLEARGELVCFFDADDLMVADKTERQVRQLQEHGLDGVIGSFLWLLEDGSLIPYPKAPLHVGPWNAEAFIEDVVCSRGPMYSAGLFRRDLLQSIGGPYQGFPLNDWPFLIHYARAARKMQVTHDVVFHYRKHPSSHSTARMHQLLGWKVDIVRALCPKDVQVKARSCAYRIIADEYLTRRQPFRAWAWFVRALRWGPQPDENTFRHKVRVQLKNAGWIGWLLRGQIRAKV